MTETCLKGALAALLLCRLQGGKSNATAGISAIQRHSTRFQVTYPKQGLPFHQRHVAFCLDLAVAHLDISIRSTDQNPLYQFELQNHWRRCEFHMLPSCHRFHTSSPVSLLLQHRHPSRHSDLLQFGVGLKLVKLADMLCKARQPLPAPTVLFRSVAPQVSLGLIVPAASKPRVLSSRQHHRSIPTPAVIKLTSPSDTPSRSVQACRSAT